VVIRVTSAVPGLPWRLFGLFRTNLTPSATINVGTWVSVGTAAPTVTWQTNVTGPAAGYGQIIAVAPTTQTANFMQFTISDPTNPDGFISAGGLYAGPGWFPLTGISYESSVGRVEQIRRTQTRGGQEYARLMWSQRRWNIAFDGVRASEVWAEVDALRLQARTGTNVLFIPDTAASDIKQAAVFGMLSEAADITYPARGADRRAWRAQITERL